MDLRLMNKASSKPSILYSEKWSHRYGKITMNEKTVKPGKIATFTVPITSPMKARELNFMTKLYRNGRKVKKSKAVTPLMFNEKFHAATISHTVPAAMKTGWSTESELIFTNIGTKKWPKKTALFVNDKKMLRIDKQINPGESITLILPITAGKKAGTKYINTDLRLTGDTLTGSSQSFAIRIDK